MGSYRPLCSIRIAHDYFDGERCRALLCRPAAAGAGLLHRRGMLFKRMAENAWALLCDLSGAGPDTDADVLFLELQLADSGFVLYTRWPDFRPDAAYAAELPAAGGDVEAAEILRSTGSRRTIGSGWCRLSLPLTRGMLDAAQAGAPPCCTLRFHAPARRWEYLFLPDPGTLPDRAQERYRLETVGGGVRYRFSPFERVQAYGREACRTRSEEPIPLRERYGFRLRLDVSAENGRTRRTVLREVPPPLPGRYLDTAPDLLRQVCRL